MNSQQKKKPSLILGILSIVLGLLSVSYTHLCFRSVSED